MRAGARSARRSLTALALVLLTTGCEAMGLRDVIGLGRRVVANDWALLAISPDQRVLRVQTFYGGEASGCNRFAGAEIDERDERVSVRMLLSQAIAPGACTDEGITRTATVRLEEPLGERPLVGCGAEPASCRVVSRGEQTQVQRPYRHVLVAGDVVAVGDEVGLSALELRDGSQRWSVPMSGEWVSPEPRFATAATVIVDDGNAGLRALSLADGRERWHAAYRSAAFPAPADPQDVATAVLSDGQIGALVLADGTVRWRRPVAARDPRAVAMAGQMGVVIAGDGSEATEGTLVEAFDLRDGVSLWSVTVPERLDTVAVVDGVVVASGPIVRYGWSQSDGAQLWRLPPFFESPRFATVATGPLAFDHERLVHFAAHSGLERRRLALDAVDTETVRVAEPLVLYPGRDAHLHVLSLEGDMVGRRPLGSLGGRPSAGASVVAVPTHLGVSVFDDDGALRWWVLRELPEEGGGS